MLQPNKRPRIQPQFVRSDHDEHHRPPHIHVGGCQTSSSTRPFFNAADNNTPHIPIGDRHMSSSTRRVYAADFNIPGGESFLKNYMDNASQENAQNMGRGGNRSSGGRSELPQYYDD